MDEPIKSIEQIVREQIQAQMFIEAQQEIDELPIDELRKRLMAQLITNYHLLEDNKRMILESHFKGISPDKVNKTHQVEVPLDLWLKCCKIAHELKFNDISELLIRIGSGCVKVSDL